MATSYRAKPWKRWFRVLRQRAVNPFTPPHELFPNPECHFALIAFQRSGTHLLREIVNSNPQLALMVETFSPTTKKLYWCNYIRSLPKNEFPALNHETALGLFDEHMRRIRRDVEIEPEWYGGRKRELKALGLDIKYNQIKAFNSLAINLRSRPLLLDYFKRRGFRIVHLVRNNLAHAALSLILANIRSVWHNYGKREFGGRYHVTWDVLFSHMKCIQDERKEFVSLSQDLPVQTFAYEDLISDLGRVNQSGEFPTNTIFLKPLAEFLGVPNYFVYDGKMHKVVNKPYSEVLENFEELVSHLRNSEFSEYADLLDTGVAQLSPAIRSRVA